MLLFCSRDSKKKDGRDTIPSILDVFSKVLVAQITGLERETKTNVKACVRRKHCLEIFSVI